MAPRKRSSSSSSSAASRKANNQPSQPSKFGIQHFFERHSQAAAPSSSSSSSSPAPSIHNPNPNPNPPLIHPSTADPPLPPPTVATNGEGTSSEISPEVTKSAPLKRFRFSPGMVIDIEEMAWAPRYGLKGMIDASVCVNIKSDTGGSYERVMPLEFKTGKGTTGHSAIEHSAQVILYTLLMSERYSKKDIDSGLLYYLHTDQTMGIKVERSDLVGLIMRRNELATDILKASNTQRFPPMLQSPTMCKGCRHLNICTVYHKAHGGNSESRPD